MKFHIEWRHWNDDKVLLFLFYHNIKWYMKKILDFCNNSSVYKCTYVFIYIWIYIIHCIVTFLHNMMIYWLLANYHCWWLKNIIVRDRNCTSHQEAVSKFVNTFQVHSIVFAFLRMSYQFWEGLKSKFGNDDRPTIHATCIF